MHLLKVSFIYELQFFTLFLHQYLNLLTYISFLTDILWSSFWCIFLFLIQNGKLLRSLKSHTAAVVSLNWEEDAPVQLVWFTFINLIKMLWNFAYLVTFMFYHILKFSTYILYIVQAHFFLSICTTLTV